MSYLIKVGARDSKLSQLQVWEVLKEIQAIHPQITFDPIWMKATGDKNLHISLRGLGKCNFFTKEVDELLLSGNCDIAIHSAKDLPDPLPEGIAFIALTRGVDPSDSLIFRDGDSLESLPAGALVGTSCARRDAMVRSLRSDLNCVDIRGSVDHRLAQLDEGKYDAIVMAEAALIRLGWTHRNRIPLPGQTTPLQGQLAILAREDDDEMKKLFSCIDVRMK